MIGRKEFLEARQVQVQKLAPRMIQSMEILQLPSLALQERIEQEMNENPLLEQQEVDPLAPDELERDREKQEGDGSDEATRMARSAASPLFWDALDQMRREMAEDWRQAFVRLGAERGFEVRPLVSFPATGANNADLPEKGRIEDDEVDLVGEG